MKFFLVLAALFACSLAWAGEFSPRIVNSMAELRALTPIPSRPYVKVLSYYGDGNGGGGDYVLTNTAAGTNAWGGRVLALGGEKSWQLNGYAVNVRQFGALGDGTTDDSAKFGAALGWAGVVEVPAGSYRLAVTNTEITRSYVKLIGKPGAILTMDATNLMNSMFYATNKTGIEISDLAFSVTTSRPTYVLRADLCTKITFQNCMVTNMGSVLTRGYTHNIFPTNWTAAQAIINAYDTSLQSDIRILNNTFRSSFDTNYPSAAIQYAAAQLNYTSDVLIQGNNIAGYGSGPFNAGGIRVWVETNGVASTTYTTTSTLASTEYLNKRWRFVGNTVTNCQAGLWLAFSKGVSFTGNTVDGCTDVGLDAELSQDVTFAGNVAMNCRNGGIYFNDWCSGITITGNTLGTTEYGRTNFPPALILKVDANNLSTNVVISGNTFQNLTSTNQSYIILANTSAGIVNLDYSGNLHFNVPVFVGRTGQGRKHSFKNNTFIHTNAIPSTLAALSINYAVGGEFEISGNSFIWDQPKRAIGSVSANQLTMVPDANPVLYGDDMIQWTNGTPVVFVQNGSSVTGLDQYTVYYTYLVSTNVYQLYDTYANAIAGGATGLIAVSGYSLGILPGQLVEYKDSQYAIKLQRYTEGGYGSLMDFKITDNLFDWPKPLLAWGDPTTQALGITNATGAFMRNTGPMYATFENNKMSGQVLDNGIVFRHDILGYNAALFHGENRYWNGQPWPKAYPTNVFVLNRSVWFDHNWATSANSGFIANRNGFWGNSQGATAWTTSTAYVVGDLVTSSGNVYACAAGGTSSVAPSGTGNVDDVQWDGTIAWIYVGSSFIQLTPRSIAQLGFRSNAGTPYNSVTPGFLGEEIYDSTSQVWWKAIGTGLTNWRPIGSMPTTETITPDASDIVVSCRKGASQLSYVNMPAGTRTLRFTLDNEGDGGDVYINPATTSQSLNFGANVFSPNGASFLTVPGGTGGTNAVVINWRVIKVGGTNRIIINPAFIYKP